jgi:maltose alpha-D-glucosyltransferase/alpha-amylase
VHNLAQAPCEARLQLDEGVRLTNLLEDGEAVADDRGVHHLELEPYAYRWYRVAGPRRL